MKLVGELNNVLVTPPARDTYDHLQTVILRHIAESEGSRRRQFLTTEEPGDRRPSQLVHRMRELLGKNPSESQNNFLRELFVQRRPANMRMILASAGGLRKNSLTKMGGGIAEHASPSMSMVASSVSSSPPLKSGFKSFLCTFTPSSCPVMITGGQLVDPHPGAASQHLHVSRDVKGVSLLLTFKRICAGITAPMVRDLTNVQVPVL